MSVRFQFLVLFWGLLALPRPAWADDSSGEPDLPPRVRDLIEIKQNDVIVVRREAIRLLQDFLKDSSPSGETAEALFKLAELTWEEAQSEYLARMGDYQDKVAACKRDRSACPQVPKRPPRLDLAQAQSTYQRLIREYPRFHKIDTVLYLYAFSLREQGKLGEAVEYFQRLLRDFPRSRFRADAWMALGEFRFYEQQDFGAALHAYEQVAKFPRSPLHGLGLFKSAWCYWKLGQGNRAAARFKDVLDLGRTAKDRGVEEQKRAAELQDQALDYLVDLFTEDDTRSAEDAYAFLVQIGGKAYTLRVMQRFADTVFDQTRYERAVQAYVFLLSLDARQLDAPEFQRRVVESYQALGRADHAAAEMRRLALDYGPHSTWASANAGHPNAIAAARAMGEEFIRTQARTLHAQAQRNEKESRIVDREHYARAAEAYDFYIQQYADAPDAGELRYLRADIAYFKLKDFRAAGDAYLAVGRGKPVGEHHKEALLQAMNAFEKLRDTGNSRVVTDDDRKFAEAADLYATLFPNDKEIVTVIYKNGQFFYDHRDYDEAIKRFGLIIERYPGNGVAGPAGDRLLECLGAAKDYENIEHWARRLKKTKSFAGDGEQRRLDDIIVKAMMKAGEGHVARENFDRAAGMFERAAKDFPAHHDAARALNNAAVAHEKAGHLGSAVAGYRALAERYPRAPEAPEALLVAARIEESIAAYGRAVVLYEQVAAVYPQSAQAPEALRGAGVLRQSMGQYDKAVVHYASFERAYKDRPETREIAFQKGHLLAEKGDARGATQAFADFARNYPGDSHAIEAMVREAEAQLKLNADARAAESLARALAWFRAHKNDEAAAVFAAEARFLQGEIIFREYERIKIGGKPRQLKRALEDKARLLDDAKKAYLDVVSFRAPIWATAALFRIGQAYETFARGMRQAKAPRDLSPDEQQIYQDELEKSVIVIEDKALDAYRSGYASALRMGVYNKHTKALRQALSTLDGQDYPRDVEVRAGPWLGETRAAAFEPIETIHRGD